MDSKAMASALLTSFNALVAVAAPDRVVPVLRHALTTLLAEEPAPRQKLSPKKSRSRWVGDIATWAPLRARILTVLATRGISRRELAAAVKITHATLKPALLPKGRAPGKANIARLQRWLKSMEAREDDAAENGGAREAAAPTAYRLSIAEREKLAAWRELEEERTLRADVGLAVEVIDEAVAGKAQAPEIVGRLVTFLQQQPAAPGP